MDRNIWLEWRRDGIGSSDAPVIHGASDWKTPYQLWEEKTSTEPIEDKTNFILEKGNEMEPLMRKLFAAQFSIEHGDCEFSPMNLAMADLPFMRASLDGFAIHNKTRIGIECKLQGKQPHENVENEKLPIRGGRIPDKYWIQMQHQILVGGLDRMYFVSTVDGKSVSTLCILPDVEFQREHIKKCAEFWRLVKKKTPPAYTDKDFKMLRGDRAKSLAHNYQFLKKEIDTLTQQLELVKKELFALVDHPRMRCGSLRIVKVRRSGSIDYSKIPELRGVDVDQYRKKSTEFWTIQEDKND